MGEEQRFNRWYRSNWIFIGRKKKDLDLNLAPYTKINSKLITGLNVKCKATKHLEGNIGKSFWDLGLGK